MAEEEGKDISGNTVPRSIIISGFGVFMDGAVWRCMEGGGGRTREEGVARLAVQQHLVHGGAGPVQHVHVRRGHAAVVQQPQPLLRHHAHLRSVPPGPSRRQRRLGNGRRLQNL